MLLFMLLAAVGPNVVPVLAAAFCVGASGCWLLAAGSWPLAGKSKGILFGI